MSPRPSRRQVLRLSGLALASSLAGCPLTGESVWPGPAPEPGSQTRTDPARSESPPGTTLGGGPGPASEPEPAVPADRLPVPGGTEDWPHPDGDPAGAKHTSAEIGPLTGEIAWRSRSFVERVIAIDGTLLGPSTGALTAVDAETGRSLWERQTPERTWQAVANEEAVFLVGDDGRVFRYGPDTVVGTVVPAAGEVRALATSGSLYLTSAGGIVAMDQDTLEGRWVARVAAEVLTARATADRLVIETGRAAATERALEARDSGSGSLRWRRSLESARLLALDGERAFLRSRDSVAARSLADGSRQWARSVTDGRMTWAGLTPAGVLTVVELPGSPRRVEVRRLDPADGSTGARFEVTASEQLRGGLTAGSRLYLTSRRDLVTVDLSNGGLAAHGVLDEGEYALRGPMAATGSAVLVQLRHFERASRDRLAALR